MSVFVRIVQFLIWSLVFGFIFGIVAGIGLYVLETYSYPAFSVMGTVEGLIPVANMGGMVGAYATMYFGIPMAIVLGIVLATPLRLNRWTPFITLFTILAIFDSIYSYNALTVDYATKQMWSMYVSDQYTYIVMSIPVVITLSTGCASWIVFRRKRKPKYLAGEY